MRQLVTALAALAAFSFAGCGDDAPSADPPGTDDGPLVTYSRSGGLSGISEQLVVDRDGDARVEAGSVGQPVSTELELTDLELADLMEMLDAAPLDAFEQSPGGCDDCFEYGIETGGESIELSDTDLQEGSGATVPNEIFALLDKLGSIVEEATASVEPNDETLLTYTRAGGFAGTFEDIRIGTDGTATLTSGRPETGDRKQTDFTIPAGELAAIEDALANAPFDEVQRGPGGCADCFEYSIEAGGEELSLSDVDFDESYGSEIPDGVDELYGLLATLLAEHSQPAS